MTAFAEAAPPTESVDVIKDAHGHRVLNVPVEPGRLDYLCSIHIDWIGELRTVRLLDANGTPISDLSGEAFRLIGNTIPIEFDDAGRGCLPNMSSHAAYRLELDGTGDGTITYTGRPLPPNYPGMQRVPPSVGIIQFWSETRNLIVDAGPTGCTVHRVGNVIRELFLLVKDRDGAPMDVDELRLHLDLTRTTFDPDHFAEGVYRYAFEEGLPTVVRTVLDARFVAPRDGTVSYVVNDISAPMPPMPRRSR